MMIRIGILVALLVRVPPTSSNATHLFLIRDALFQPSTSSFVVTRPRSQCQVRRGPEKKPRTFRLIPSEQIGIHPRSAQSIAAFRSENAICDMDLAPNPDTAVLACAAEGTREVATQGIGYRPVESRGSLPAARPTWDNSMS